jgi:hypothetical protein
MGTRVGDGFAVGEVTIGGLGLGVGVAAVAGSSRVVDSTTTNTMSASTEKTARTSTGLSFAPERRALLSR